MLSHDTAESRSNTVKITDFDYETVKAAVDFCYGREPENLCVDKIVGILRFADKYDIQAVTDDLAMIPLANLSPETFATIAHYAYDCSKDALFQACCKYFKNHQSEIVITKKFTILAPSFVACLLKQAFNLKTQFDVLRHAHANGIGFILDPLEQPIIEAMFLNTFCDTVKYAWECSRDDLKNACGKFFNDYQSEITRMKGFYDLPPNVVYEVLKKGLCTCTVPVSTCLSNPRTSLVFAPLTPHTDLSVSSAGFSASRSIDPRSIPNSRNYWIGETFQQYCLAEMEAVKTVHDTVTIVLNEADLTGMKVGEYLKTPRRYIPCSDGLKWRIRYHPAGHNIDSANYLSVYMYVNMEVSAKFRYELNGTVLRQSSAPYMERGAGYNKLVSHKKLRPLFINGQLSIVFHIEFDIPVPFSFLTSRMVRFCDHLPTDFDIVVGLDRVKVHKGYISMISPVINAMLSHDTAESRSNTVKITDFDFETVKAAIDFCYGREPENLCVDTIVEILRFADKYDIRAVTEDLANIPLANLYPETFAAIALYAYDCSKDDLFKTCRKYFKESLSEIVTAPKFTTLTPYFVAHLLKEAFHLKTPYDVLRRAHANGIGFILDPLEKTVIENISLDTFCITVSYAWECSRDDLKTACGKFFNDNQAEIRKMKEFYDLPPNVFYDVLKNGADVL